MLKIKLLEINLLTLSRIHIRERDLRKAFNSGKDKVNIPDNCKRRRQVTMYGRQ
ncbi:MAG: hypothetical protein KatS3mg032_0565 [Cyclobacteriaceae bacterium]|nr:MAG: hypothetical protein KatS3mg032_0565 [Cyclobacteriaceae bacterium]